MKLKWFVDVSADISENAETEVKYNNKVTKPKGVEELVTLQF